MANVSDEQARRKPAPDRWSIAEVLEHLSHSEEHCYRARLERMLTMDNPEIEVYDTGGFNATGVYANPDPEESFAHWEERREDNLEFLRKLEPSALARIGSHARWGEITIEDLLNEWACHDLGHVRQIAELVRVVVYYPAMGPFQGAYPGLRISS